MAAFMFYGFLIVLCLSCSPGPVKSNVPMPEAGNKNLISYTLKKSLSHNRKAYTQGLVYYGDKVYESTGANQSWIAELDLQSGRQEKKVVLDKKYFGEGITILNNKVYQLTWKHKKGFIYRAGSFEELGTFSYSFDGWGITTDGHHLIVSDGSSKLHFMDSLTFRVIKSLAVHEEGAAVEALNELEYIDNYIYANQWETSYILKIDPHTGAVVGKLDLTDIVNRIKSAYSRAGVLNGIAHNPATGDLLITGKRWPKAFILRLN
ncbi:glutamine cyclotransferase [Flammeovirgaceae bacterium 311]|nr:glutamine cyclotransferase [Flammeovirgaceae bacterium 311]